MSSPNRHRDPPRGSNHEDQRSWTPYNDDRHRGDDRFARGRWDPRMGMGASYREDQPYRGWEASDFRPPRAERPNRGHDDGPRHEDHDRYSYDRRFDSDRQREDRHYDDEPHVRGDWRREQHDWRPARDMGRSDAYRTGADDRWRDHASQHNEREWHGGDRDWHRRDHMHGDDNRRGDYGRDGHGDDNRRGDYGRDGRGDYGRDGRGDYGRDLRGDYGRDTRAAYGRDTRGADDRDDRGWRGNDGRGPSDDHRRGAYGRRR
jgi:hypothetical protein